MTIKIIALTVYIISVYYMYKFNQKAHSKGGRWSTLDVELPDLIFTFVPIVNTIAILPTIAGDGKILNKIFRVKK